MNKITQKGEKNCHMHTLEPYMDILKCERKRKTEDDLLTNIKRCINGGRRRLFM